MKVLGVDFSCKDDNKVISMCRLSNDKGGIDLEYIDSFKEDKNYDLKSLICSQVTNLGLDYVVIDKCGINYTLYKDLKDILDDKVIGLESNIKKENEIINRLAECPLLEELGFDLKYKMYDNAYVKFDIKAYGSIEYLNIRSLALANYYILEKLFEEEKKENKSNLEKINMVCKLKLNCGFGEATIYNVTDNYNDNNGNFVIKQGDGEVKIKLDIIDRVIVNKLD